MVAQQNDVSPDTQALYAWLSRDQDGIEGIITAPLGNLGVIPLVAADGARARALEPVAAAAARRRGFPATLVRFARQETVLTVP